MGFPYSRLLMLEQCDQEDTSSEQIPSHTQLDITALINSECCFRVPQLKDLRFKNTFRSGAGK